MERVLTLLQMSIHEIFNASLLLILFLVSLHQLINRRALRKLDRYRLLSMIVV